MSTCETSWQMGISRAGWTVLADSFKISPRRTGSAGGTDCEYSPTSLDNCKSKAFAKSKKNVRRREKIAGN